VILIVVGVVALLIGLFVIVRDPSSSPPPGDIP
jgi:hypothetical protein